MATTRPAAAPVRTAAPAVRTESARKSGATVAVACKIPHGIIMQLCKETEFWEDTPSGSKLRKRFDRCGERKFIRGNSYPVNPPAGFPERGPQVAGYAITTGVDADFWDAWLKQNAKAPMVVNKLIFAMPTLDGLRGKSMDLKDTRSGLEPLSIDGKDPRIPKPTNAAVAPIETAVID